VSKFVFRLATLLRVRESTRDERRRDLGKAHEAEEILNERKQELEREAQEVASWQASGEMVGKIDVDRLLGRHRYELVLNGQRQVLNQQSEQLQAEIERRRQVLVEADREVRVLEKLRERKQAEHEQLELLQQQKVMDEIAQTRTSGQGVQ
jgi:flagellar FliJ protein